MVFISNMRANQIEPAILSRSMFVDVYLSATDVLKRIKTILRIKVKSDPTITDQDVDEVIEALGEKTGKQLTVRAAMLALKMKKSGLNNWQRLATMYA